MWRFLCGALDAQWSPQLGRNSFQTSAFLLLTRKLMFEKITSWKCCRYHRNKLTQISILSSHYWQNSYWKVKSITRRFSNCSSIRIEVAMRVSATCENILISWSLRVAAHSISSSCDCSNNLISSGLCDLSSNCNFSCSKWTIFDCNSNFISSHFTCSSCNCNNN